MCWPLRNILISNDNGSFIFYVDVSFLYHCQDFYRTWLYLWVTRRVTYKKQEQLTLRDHLDSSPIFSVCSVSLISLVFYVALLCVFTFWIQCDLCLIVYSGVQYILCCIFVLFFLDFFLFWLSFRYSLTFISLHRIHVCRHA